LPQLLLTAGLGVFNGRVDGIFAGYSSDIRSGFEIFGFT
jgi:hypothetical protein